MRYGVPSEHSEGERRVALVPADVPRLKAGTHEVLVEAGAGAKAGYDDAHYAERGAAVVVRAELIARADALLTVRSGAAAPPLGEDRLRRGQIVVGLMEPWAAHPSFERYESEAVSAFALELIPRITRAQSMDVLSSQASLVGYRGALLAAEHLPKIFPMLMTAAGTVVPARVFVIGAGVAGLQAIATARRLGAVVSATDVRSAAREQVESLGAKFIEFAVGNAEGAGGYARELTQQERDRQRELMADYCRGVDVIITTAAVPGRTAPKLVTKRMVESLAPGSVVVDLSAERGGNCELSSAGRTVVHAGVTIAAPLNLASSVAYHASQLYSRNITTFAALLAGPDGNARIDTSDEIISACLIVHEGALRRSLS